jgi:hypothetical protein
MGEVDGGRKVRDGAQCKVITVAANRERNSRVRGALRGTGMPFVLRVAVAEAGVCPARMRLPAELTDERLEFSDAVAETR